jgi:eukaryotic-like serine/threonine-protein kinase
MTGETPSSEADSSPSVRMRRFRLDEDVEAERLRSTVWDRLFAPAPRLPRSGRYTLLTKVGSGGGGVVYAARDAELGRRVALKFVRPASGISKAGDARRLLAEARALARLSHPNVVTIYDVGLHDDGIFLAMELVDGVDLASWLQGERGWQDVLEVFIAAGRGLVAAHAAGLIHRDFKPRNVFVGGDGRVRVGDFGLAKSLAVPSSEDAGSERTLVGAIVQDDDVSLTKSGVVVGTPPYLAPEQHDGEPATALSDQYSFCVALWVGLYGRHPFVGTMRELARQKREGVPSVRPQASIPRWLHRVLVRGLAPRPRDRWPSMEELLARLGRTHRWSRTTGLAGIAFAGAGAVWVASSEPPEPVGCVPASERLDGVWDDTIRGAVREAFWATDVVHATQTFDLVRSRLDAYASEWSASYADTCVAPATERTDGRRLCLERRLRDLEALTEVLAESDTGVVARAVEAATKLPPVERCLDPTIQTELPVDIDEALSRVRALTTSGRHRQAIELATAVREQARASGDRSAIAAAALALGLAYSDVHDDLGSAESALVEAYFAAREVGRDEDMVIAASRLAHVIGYGLARPQEGREWLRHAETACRRAGKDPEHDGGYTGALVAIMLGEGDHRGAIDLGLRTLAIEEARWGPADVRLRETLGKLGVAYYLAFDFEAAAHHFERAVQVTEHSLGRLHPAMASVLTNLGGARERLGELELALATYEDALEVAESTLGRTNQVTAMLWLAKGSVLTRLQRHEESERLHRRGVEALEAVLGPEHPEVAKVLSNWGVVLGNLERHEEALDVLRRSQALSERAWGPDDPRMSFVIKNIGKVLLESGQAESAIPYFERAIALEADNAHDAIELAFTRHALARALWAEGRHEEARTAAERALVDLEAEGERTASDRAEIDAWLEQHETP